MLEVSFVLISSGFIVDSKHVKQNLLSGGFFMIFIFIKSKSCESREFSNRHLVFVRADVAETNKTEGEQVTFFLCLEGFKTYKQKSVT